MKRERRSMRDRRLGKDRRKTFSFKQMWFNDEEKRKAEPRRGLDERRHGWVRMGRWSGVYLPDLKIGKFLK